MGNHQNQDIDFDFLPRVGDNPFVKREILHYILSFIPLVEFSQEEGKTEVRTFPVMKMMFVCKYFRKHTIQHITKRKVIKREEIYNIFKSHPPELVMMDLFREHSFFHEDSKYFLFEEVCSFGYTTLFLTLLKIPDFEYPSSQGILKRACQGGHVDVVQKLVTSPSLSILEPLESRQEAFLISCTSGHLSLLPILTRFFSDLDLTHHENEALKKSVENGQTEVVKWLLGDERVISDTKAIDTCMRSAFDLRNKNLVKLLMKAPELYKKFEHAKQKLKKLNLKLEKEIRIFRSFSKIVETYEQVKTCETFFLNSIPGYFIIFPHKVSHGLVQKNEPTIQNSNDRRHSSFVNESDKDSHLTPLRKKRSSPTNSPHIENNIRKLQTSTSALIESAHMRRHSTIKSMKAAMYTKEEASIYFLRFFTKLIQEFRECRQKYESEFIQLKNQQQNNNKVNFYRGSLNGAGLPHSENGEIWVERRGGGVLRSVIKLRKIFSGRFENGVKSGNGKEFWLENGKLKFRGVYSSGRREGLGQSYEKDGKKVDRTGVWRNGKFYRYHMDDLELDVVDFGKLKKYFRRENRLGGGTYGDVYRVMYLKGGEKEEAAAKVLNIPTIELRDIIIAKTAKSLRINASLYHPNIVKVFAWSGGIQRVFEYGSGGGGHNNNSDKPKNNSNSQEEDGIIINKEISDGDEQQQEEQKNENKNNESSSERPKQQQHHHEQIKKVIEEHHHHSNNSSSPLQFDDSKFNIGYVMELCENGSISNLIGGDMNLIPMKEKVRWLYSTALGMEYLHSNQVMHRDLKWANVLLNSLNDVKITDFDFAKADESAIRSTAFNRSVIGTPIYCAPEVLLQKNYNASCDVYSFAIMVYTLTANTLNPYKLELFHPDMTECSCGEKLENIFGTPSLLFHIANCELRPNTKNERLLQIVGKDWAWLIDLMKICWPGIVDRRPTFTGIVNFIKTHLQQTVTKNGRNSSSILSINMISMKVSHQEDSEAEKYLLTDLSIKGLLELIRKTWGKSKTIENIHIKKKKIVSIRTYKSFKEQEQLQKKKESNNNNRTSKNEELKEQPLEEEETIIYERIKVSEDEHVRSIRSTEDIVVIEFLEKEDQFDSNNNSSKSSGGRRPSNTTKFFPSNQNNDKKHNNDHYYENKWISSQKENQSLQKQIKEKEDTILQLTETYESNLRRIEEQLELSNVDKSKVRNLVRKMKEHYEVQMEKLREVEIENKYLRKEKFDVDRKNKALSKNNRRLLILLKNKLREEMRRSSVKEIHDHHHPVDYLSSSKKKKEIKNPSNRIGMLGPAHLKNISERMRPRSVFVDPSHVRNMKKDKNNILLSFVSTKSNTNKKNSEEEEEDEGEDDDDE